MDRKIALSILAITLIALTAAMLIPGGRAPEQQPRLPWMINIDPQGTLSVFGITLGHSTLREAREQLLSQGKENLFLAPDGRYHIEVYFQRLFLSGLKADLVLTLAVSEESARAMYDRGARISNLGSGTRKVELSDEDRRALTQLPIHTITYIPAADLDAELLASRFGEPARRLSEPESDIVHWLYPERGLDIALNPNGKEVFQYITPREFEKIQKPLVTRE